MVEQRAKPKERLSNDLSLRLRAGGLNEHASRRQRSTTAEAQSERQGVQLVVVTSIPNIHKSAARCMLAGKNPPFPPFLWGSSHEQRNSTVAPRLAADYRPRPVSVLYRDVCSVGVESMGVRG